MTTKAQVMAAHKEHPEWTAPEIAAALGCTDSYVRATAQRNGIDLPKAKFIPGNPDQGAQAQLERIVGRAALAAGLTLEKIAEYAATKKRLAA